MIAQQTKGAKARRKKAKQKGVKGVRKNAEEQRREMRNEEFNEIFVDKAYWKKRGGSKKKSFKKTPIVDGVHEQS